MYINCIGASIMELLTREDNMFRETGRYFMHYTGVCIYFLESRNNSNGEVCIGTVWGGPVFGVDPHRQILKNERFPATYILNEDEVREFLLPMVI